MEAPSCLRTSTVLAGLTWDADAAFRVGKMCSRWAIHLCLLSSWSSKRMKKQVSEISSCPTIMHHMMNRLWWALMLPALKLLVFWCS